MNGIYEQIINLSYSHFAMNPVTPETIRAFIERSKGFYPEHQIDEKELFIQLDAIHSVSIEDDVRILDDVTDHEEWFNPDTNRPLHREFDWHFWDHYRHFLIHWKNWPSNIVKGLDRFSSLVLCRVEDPTRLGPWDRRGMVVGEVQSGKTANYTALITKAADAGYKLFVVLAGVHNSLRSQTQERLNEEFLGYDLDIIQKITGQEKRVGVRKMFPRNHRVVNTLTSSAQNGDFKTSVARQAGIIPSMTGDPIILISKKNVTILKNIIEWATSLGDIDKSGRRIVRNIPFLLIDDESDFASVNTKKPERDENGAIIEEWDPAKTNMLIRQLLSSFEKSIYVGYTATPYANIFIHRDDPHPTYGDDLFPKHFLISLPKPSNYIGPEEVFGLKADPVVTNEVAEPLPLVREVDDTDDIIPGSHKSDRLVDALPESLINAMKAFILVCSARRLRANGIPHNSMLVHVTRFTRIQGQVKDLVENELRALTARAMNSADPLTDFRRIWEEDFVPTSKKMSERGYRDARVHNWEVILPQIYESAKAIRIRGINGDIGDTLDYRLADRRARAQMEKGDAVPWHERGISVIAVGGDKLSRGLTLDGLSISYYLRSARMYDTLMQMGRWFGYREGYNDLCRICTTDELIEWYRHIALANRELQIQFEYMEAVGSTPEKFGLRVRSHPGRLAITSVGKARATERMAISYAGEFPKTVVFDPRQSAVNRDALSALIRGIGRSPDIQFDPNRPRFHWKDVDPSVVVHFLESYKTQEEAKRVVDPARIADFIRKQLAKKELTTWHVVIVSNPERYKFHEVSIEPYTVACVFRKPILPVQKDKVSIGTLTNPADEALDLTEEELELARNFDRNSGRTISGPGDLPSSGAIRQIRPATRGLLLVYMPACHTGEWTFGLAGEEIVGFAVSFPASTNAEAIQYVVNSVYTEEDMK